MGDIWALFHHYVTSPSLFDPRLTGTTVVQLPQMLLHFSKALLFLVWFWKLLKGPDFGGGGICVVRAVL